VLPNSWVKSTLISSNFVFHPVASDSDVAYKTASETSETPEIQDSRWLKVEIPDVPEDSDVI
jgi:hypothetical protein